jgi:methionyl-tRNA synthetase
MKYYITTAIDYVNGTIHIGHAFQKVVADVLARYHRITLGKENVFFLTGTDEYGQNVARAAEKNGVTPKELADKVSQSDQEEQDSLNISYDRFIRTTDEDHARVAQEIWKRVDAAGDIYLGEFTGLYCPSCEAYYTEEDLINGRCPLHPTIEIQKVTEQNFFFKWSKYQDFLIDLLENNPGFALPESRKNEMLAFLRRGLQDIPISRTSFNWGIPVPNQPEHVMYVWFDALTNYLTGVGFLENTDKFKKFWPADLHILGKDNFQKHTLLWPAMLKSAGIELPKQVYGHGFLSLNGQKISKTLGNVVFSSDWVKKYGADAVRYYLLRYSTLEEDGDVSEEKLLQSYNSDLANGLGNLVARVAKLCEQNEINAPTAPTEFDPELVKYLKNYKLNEALNHIWGEISDADRKVNEEKPWELEGERVKEVLEDLVGRILHIAFNLQPFLPETSEKILKQFSGQIKSAPGLFPRI